MEWKEEEDKKRVDAMAQRFEIKINSRDDIVDKFLSELLPQIERSANMGEGSCVSSCFRVALPTGDRYSPEIRKSAIAFVTKKSEDLLAYVESRGFVVFGNVHDGPCCGWIEIYLSIAISWDPEGKFSNHVLGCMSTFGGKNFWHGTFEVGRLYTKKDADDVAK